MATVGLVTSVTGFHPYARTLSVTYLVGRVGTASPESPCHQRGRASGSARVWTWRWVRGSARVWTGVGGERREDFSERGRACERPSAWEA